MGHELNQLGSSLYFTTNPGHQPLPQGLTLTGNGLANTVIDKVTVSQIGVAADGALDAGADRCTAFSKDHPVSAQNIFMAKETGETLWKQFRCVLEVAGEHLFRLAHGPALPDRPVQATGGSVGDRTRVNFDGLDLAVDDLHIVHVVFPNMLARFIDVREVIPGGQPLFFVGVIGNHETNLPSGIRG